jgi:acyl-CoA reductase-like NAD-dependent aldehyde dehydrogenase
MIQQLFWISVGVVATSLPVDIAWLLGGLGVFLPLIYFLRARVQGKVVFNAPDLFKTTIESSFGEEKMVVKSTELQLRPAFIQCYNPSTMQLLGEVAVTTPSEVLACVGKARASQRAWAKTGWDERRRVLRCILATIQAHAEDIVKISAIDTGKQRIDSYLGEIITSQGKLSWIIAEGETVLAPQDRPSSLTTLHKSCRVEFAPLGVLGVIAPWNYPFYNMYNHIASGLFAGNAVVIKISEYSAWSGANFIVLARRCLEACGHSQDLVQVVQGFGETGSALVSNVDKVRRSALITCFDSGSCTPFPPALR